MKRLLLLPLIAVTLGGCSLFKAQNDGGDDKIVRPVRTDQMLAAANVRGAVVLATRESRGGGAVRQDEWADYLYNRYHAGVGYAGPEREDDPAFFGDGNDGKDKDNGKGDGVAKEGSDASFAESAIPALDRSVYVKMKDRSVYSRDRSVYSKDRSVYTKDKKRKASKKRSKAKAVKAKKKNPKKYYYIEKNTKAEPLATPLSHSVVTPVPAFTPTVVKEKEPEKNRTPQNQSDYTAYLNRKN